MYIKKFFSNISLALLLLCSCNSVSDKRHAADNKNDLEAIIYRAFNTDVFIVDTEDVLHRYEESCPYCKYISIGIKIENKSAVCKYIPIRNLSDKMYRSRIKVYKDGSELKTICICSGFKENNIVPPGDSAFIELKILHGQQQHHNIRNI